MAEAVSIVIPNWNGLRWLAGCLDAIAAQTVPPTEIIVVDNGSTDGSRECLEQRDLHLVSLSENRGFASAANLGISIARCEFVALLNSDVVLMPDWIELMTNALREDPCAASVACKMVSLDDPTRLYDAGDLLRRDGACEQRGRFTRDDGSFDAPGEVFGACAGAALYRRSVVHAIGGFDERYFAYLEDVDLALRLRLEGWRCRYQPAVARHAGEGSAHQLRGGPQFLVTRNTVVLVAIWFPLRWLPHVAYRQLGWLWHAARERRLTAHLGALAAAVPMLPAALRARRARRSRALRGPVPIDVAVPARPLRGARAGGHRSSHARPPRD